MRQPPPAFKMGDRVVLPGKVEGVVDTNLGYISYLESHLYIVKLVHGGYATYREKFLTAKEA
jgi:hypothetical protein